MESARASMEIRIMHGLTGNEIALFELEQESIIVHDIRRMIKASRGVSKKTQRLCIGATCLKARDTLTPSSNGRLILTLVEIEPRCMQCGESAMELRVCSACLDALYCGIPCQRRHWRQHRVVCEFRPESACE